jgi:hypothetical protein
VRVWTADEANAALVDVTARVEQVRTLVRQARGTGNGQRRPSPRAVQDALDALEADGIVLRDAERGLVDFHAVAPSGRPYWLCWLVDEEEIGWWHWPEDGFAGRTPLSNPPT